MQPIRRLMGSLFLLGAVLFSPALTPVSAQAIQNQTVNNINAGGDAWVYYSLADQQEVPSAQADWDLAFKGTSIRVNGGLQLVDQPFDDITEAPAEGYTPDALDSPAMPSGSGNGWYLYDADNHALFPVENRTLLIETAEKAYIKLEVLSYYQMSDTGEMLVDRPRFYSFRYSYQPDGRAF